MEEEKRKPGRPFGSTTGRAKKTISCRIDPEVMDYLNTVGNRNSYINDVLHDAMTKTIAHNQAHDNTIVCPYCKNIISIKPAKTK